MSLLPHSSHNRRALSPRVSFTGPTPSRRIAKRTHSNVACSPSYDDSAASPTWEQGPWRLAKRARIARTSSYTKMAAIPGLTACPPGLVRPADTISSKPTSLATTSAAFGLPSRPMRNLRRPRPAARPSMRAQENPRVELGEVLSLNAQAFGELRQNITSCSEDFVERMRVLEAERSASAVRNPTPGSPMHLDASESSDEEDIEIVSSEPSSDASSARLPETAPHICSSLPAQRMETTDASDVTMLPFLPTHTLARSTRRNSLSAIYDIPIKPRNEDRAIDALSLAMSTGAAGIRDYSAVRDALGTGLQAEAAAEVGDMWD